MREKKEAGDKDLRAFEENPYNPDKTRPEDLARLFYAHNLPLIPVVSRRGQLFGILMKDDLVAEMSDIDRFQNQKIDQFITRLARKMKLDELAPHALPIKEFVTINIFGEVQGTWSRIELFNACESLPVAKSVNDDIDRQKESQVLEWMIYLILEHIPRPIYAVNKKGKTIFYNSHFEDMVREKTKEEMNIEAVEESLKNPDKNEFFYRKKGGKEIYFFNTDMDFYYERTPLQSDRKNVGYLIYCARGLNESGGSFLPAVDTSGSGLREILELVERNLLMDAIRRNGSDLKKAAAELSISAQMLRNRMSRLGVEIKPGRGVRAKK